MSNEMLKVTDLSATSECPERTHELIINGQIERIKFEYGKEKELPYSVGIKFRQAGFIVRDAATNEEIAAPAVTDETVRYRIFDDEVVAKYDELTISALKLRAAALPNGEKFLTGDAEKGVIIAFLNGAVAVSIEPEPEAVLEDDEDALESVAVAETPEPEHEADMLAEPEPEAQPQRAGGRGRRG